jgi:hypothetical protein
MSSWPRASAARSKRIPVSAAAAAAKAAETSTLATTEPVVATSIPASSGPRKVPSPSPKLEATLAATSSRGERANAGRSAVWIGLTSDPAPATTAASTNVSSIGRSIATTPAVAIAPTDRTVLIASRTRSPRKRTTSLGASGAKTIHGTTRIAPRTPAARAPPASYATTSSTTRNAPSAAVPAVHAISILRIAPFRRTSRTAPNAVERSGPPTHGSSQEAPGSPNGA